MKLRWFVAESDDEATESGLHIIFYIFFLREE
jgi:hypothetical protein